MSTNFDLDVNQRHKTNSEDTENIADENFEGLETGGVFDFSITDENKENGCYYNVNEF